VFTINQINRLTFTWVVFSVVAALFLCYFEVIQNTPIIWILLFASALMIWQFTDLLRTKESQAENRKYSILLDLYFLLVMLLLISDRILT
jgi:4-hydroxybenzoate polyprenyltransferase